jgi:hypothetical protein
MDIHHIHILHLQSVIHRMVILLHHIHTIILQPVVRRVVMLLYHIYTIHICHIHTLHLNMFTLEVVTPQVEEKTPHIQLKLR